MSEDLVKQFAAYLATLPEDQRRGALARANLSAMQQTPEEKFEPPIATLSDFLATQPEVPPELVSPYLVVRGGLNATIGRAGKGKTVMNLNRMLRWAAGLPMFDGWKHPETGVKYLQPTDALKILIIENEGAGALFHRQIGIMLNTAPEFLSEDARKQAAENVLIWGEGGWSDLKFDDQNKLNLVREGCEKWNPDLIYVEPFRSLWKGEENSATEMAQVIDAMVGIANDYNCGVIVAHHERKSGSGEDGEKMSAGRGSTVLEGAVTVMENFESVKSGAFRELSWSKARHEAPPPAVRMEWVPEHWWYKHVPVSDLDASIINCLKENSDEALTAAQVADETEEKITYVRKRLKQLVDEGRLRKLSAENSLGGARFRLATDSQADHGGLSL